MTPDKNFKIKKSIKTMLALLTTNTVARSEFKHAMIDAQLCEEAARRASLRSKDNKESNNGVKGSRTSRAHTASIVE